ncbi:MAG: hypothetical protein OXN15_05650, partial [Chloroflexota bacterium]|nr:hypothetical protein [Chloroflexota bacterium]
LTRAVAEGSENAAPQRPSRRGAGATDAEAKPAARRRPRPPHGQAASDIEDAAAGAEQLGMPLEDQGLDPDDAEFSDSEEDEDDLEVDDLAEDDDAEEDED